MAKRPCRVAAYLNYVFEADAVRQRRPSGSVRASRRSTRRWASESMKAETAKALGAALLERRFGPSGRLFEEVACHP